MGELFPFKGHPFKVLDDEAMQEMVESIKIHGVLVPGIARPRGEGGYELVAGHRRRHALELSYLTRDEQKELLGVMGELSAVPSLEQARRLKKYSQEGRLGRDVMDAVLTEEREAPVQVTLRKERLKQYFPRSYTQAQMEEVIFSLLETWKKNNNSVTE